MTDQIGPVEMVQLGYCPTCFAVVPTLKQREHATYHRDRDEPYGEVLPLPSVAEVEQHLRERGT